MTALSQYQRLESQGLWRATPQSQRMDVIVSFGDATLVLSNKNDMPLTHWSLPAITRINPGETPAIYAPAKEDAETLELDDELMIDAIETVRSAVAKGRPQPGRLRLFLLAAGLAVGFGITVFWLPGALTRYTASIVPASKRADIGRAVLDNISRVAGSPCTSDFGAPALTHLQTRLMHAGETLIILPSGVQTSKHLPGGFILLSHALVEDFENPDVIAGYALAEAVKAKASDPLFDLLSDTGITTSVRLLTTGEIPSEMLETYAEGLMLALDVPLANEPLLHAFQTAGVSSTPYAYAVDVSGETTLGLIEADPFATGTQTPLLSDGDWVSLQGICGA